MRPVYCLSVVHGENLSNLTAPGLSLAAAVSWGAADFSGGIATKSADTFRVVLLAHLTGLIFMLGLAVASREPVAPGPTLLWAAAAGLAGGIGLAAFYRALAIGTMGINAPLSAVITAMVPLAFSFVTEGVPGAVRIGGFVLALVSIWIIASPRRSAWHEHKGIWLAVIAGVGFGGFLLLMKVAGTSGVFWPLAAARAASCLLMLTIVSTSAPRVPVRGGAMAYTLVAGVLDSGANALYVAAAQRGRLDMAAVLSSLYPASTVVLARFVLQERLSRAQAAGMILALAAVALISA